ncbi:MAG: hypothetical protein HOO96_05395 [Polyangiaceae bacterium]|nr:hypothetical protein [Polyangiaceae bacterium]
MKNVLARVFSVPRLPRAIRVAPALALALLLPGVAGAVGTRTFQLDTLEKLSGGELKGVAVGSDGVVRPGLSLGNTPLTDASTVFSALTLGDGSVLLGTSPSGKIMRVQGEQSTLYADTGALAVTSLVQGPGGSVYAATIPDGKIFKVTQGKADLYATLPGAGHVWALAVSKGSLFAAAGPDGRVFKVEAGNASSVYFKSDEPNLVSLVADSNGDLLAGSSGKGILYRISGPGRATVVQDFAGDEVKALAVSPKGAVYAIVNEYTEPPEPPRRSPVAGSRPPGPNGASRPRPGKGALYRIDGKGRVERLMRHDEFHYMSLALDDAGEPYVGTGNEGRVYTVDDAHAVTLVADTDERQIGALAIHGTSGFVAASDPPVHHRILGRGGNDALWISKALDCTLPARFGALSFQTTGGVEISTRSGNTQAPDGTWSGWTTVGQSGQRVASPGARFIQVRARLRDGRASLSGLTVPFVTENMRAVVTDVTAAPKGINLVREPVSTLPSTGGDTPKHDATVRLTWRVENPDSDALRYRVAFQRDGQTLWRDLLRNEETLTKTEYDWDTGALPEGKYRVRVEASDEFVNPPGDAQKHALVSEPFLVDNTPPVFRAVEVRGRRLTAQVQDGLGPVVRVELSVDGRSDFRPLGAKDGLFDSADESVDADVSSLVPAGPHIVTIRAFDAAGNAAMVEREVN